MGIVAFCPNGHRMKVKDELAGKKGICPTCSARFRIPHLSADPRSAARPNRENRLPTARVVSLDPVMAASLPVAFALDEAAAVDEIEPIIDVADAAPDFAPLDATAQAPKFGEHPADLPALEPAIEEPAARSAPAHAALEERPDLAWCVAVRGGAPSLPLDAAAMRAWLDSGAATAEHVVWRTDWPDWRPLGEVFPDALPPHPRGWP